MGFLECVEHIANVCPESLLLHDIHQKTALHKAVYRGQVVVAKMMLELPLVQEKLTCIDGFATVTSNQAPCLAVMRNERRKEQHRLPIQPVTGLNNTTDNNNQIHEGSLPTEAMLSCDASDDNLLDIPSYLQPQPTPILPDFSLLYDDEENDESESSQSLEKDTAEASGASPNTSIDTSAPSYILTTVDSSTPIYQTGSEHIQADIPSTVHTFESGHSIQASPVELCLEGFSFKKIKHETTHSDRINSLDLATVTDLLNKKYKILREIIKNIPVIGVYVLSLHQTDEKIGQYYCFGDENAGMTMIHHLIHLGAQNIHVMLSPPVKSTPAQRKEMTCIDRLHYVEKQHVALHKLALLFPDFDPELMVPQTIIINDSKVTFIPSDWVNIMPRPVITLSFQDGELAQAATGLDIDSFMQLRPFRFGKILEHFLTDFVENKCNTIPIISPPNSIIPSIKEPPPENIDKWLELQLVRFIKKPAASIIKNNIIILSQLSSSKNIFLGIVYGIHHSDVDCITRNKILSLWIESLKVISINHNKPTVLLLSSNTVNNQQYKNISFETNIIYADLSQGDTTEQLYHFTFNGVMLCLMPSLPKPVFNHLLQATNIPALVEGANTTTTLLENGKPYLSVLPQGATCIPKDMGDPFEAMKAEAFSYKLALGQKESLIMMGLYRKLEKDNYQACLDEIQHLQEHDKRAFNALSFLWPAQSSTSFLNLKSINAMTLIGKGLNKRLGSRGKNTLMSVFHPPSSIHTAQYITDALDASSITRHHHRLQQSHVQHPVNNAVEFGLYQWAKYKGLIAPILK